MPKATIALDDWKLPVFRKHLTDAGYAYEDAGAPSPNITLLNMQFTDRDALTKVVLAAAAECERTGPPQ